MESHREEKKYDEVDFDSAIEDFGEETVQFCVSAFLEKTYKELKANIPKLYKTQNYKEIRGKMHILKTNSGYMGAANFSALCKEFETSCKFESLNEEKIDELYPIFMTNLDKLYSRLKKLYKERFEAPQEPEPEPVSEIQKEQEKKPEETKENTEKAENKEMSQNKDNTDIKENKEKQEDKKDKNEIKDNKENQENNLIKESEKNIDNNNNKNEIKDNKENNTIIENKEIKENNERKENKIENNEKKIVKNEITSNKNQNEVIDNNTDNKQTINNNEIMEENDEEEANGGFIELKKCPKESGNDLTLKKLVSTSNKDLPVINTNDITVEKNTKNINFLIPTSSLSMKKIQKIRNFSSSNLSSSNIHELRNVKEGKIDTFRGNPRYEKIVRSFEMAKEENKRKKENKVSMSPKHTVETEKNKVLNRVKLGFSTMDRNEIRDCLKRYDIAVLKNSATLVNDNLNKFLNDVFPTIINDLNIYLLECDLSKKKEIIEKVNIIISNMKYLSDNYNVFFFRINEKLEICRDNEKFKVILNQLIQKLYMLEEELTIIDKVKIKKDDTFLKKMGYFQDSTYTKTSKKNVGESLFIYRNKENNNEQIEGLKKNLGVNNGKIKEQKSSKKKLKHYPYSFKDQKLFMIEDKKQIYSSFKASINHESNKLVNKSQKTLLNKFEEELPKFNEFFRESINNKSKEQLIQVISDFEGDIVKKYGFANLEPVMEKWVTKIKKGDSFDELNANIEDIEEVFDFMKKEISNKNLEVIGHEEESQNDDNYYEEDNDNKDEEDPIEKEDMALYSQLRQFNAASFFQPKNQGLSQHKFKLKVEKIIRETNGNSHEIIKNNQNSNYNLVEKISSHIVLSQNFRTKKNKLIGFSYPFKEDTFLNNCYIF